MINKLINLFFYTQLLKHILSWCDLGPLVKEALWERAVFRDWVREEDKMLDDSTIFHLAMKYDVDSLQVLINIFKQKGLTEELKGHLSAKSNSDYTPMHIAASNPDKEALG